MERSLLAFDTNHIKGYVFNTDKLKEIRGASSILNLLNVDKTKKEIEKFDKKAIQIYANGGSSLFIVHTNSVRAEEIGQKVQKQYRELTGGGASITYAVQPLPSDSMEDILTENLQATLDLLRLRLQQNKSQSPEYIATPTHALLLPCNACGVAYAEERDLHAEAGEQDKLYCTSCIKKRNADHRIKIDKDAPEKLLWERIQNELKVLHYKDYNSAKRPNDFNVFREFIQGKEYLGLIYADGNDMGKIFSAQKKLGILGKKAKQVDDAVFKAMATAITKHLPVFEGKNQGENKQLLFPFDILLVGGDDIVMVTSAAKALQVSATIAEQFQTEMDGESSLCVGVVLAPVKYPFGLTRELAESTLKAAKIARAKTTASEKTFINFMAVSGSTSLNYSKVYNGLKRDGENLDNHFYATLRPYTLTMFKQLLSALQEGNKKRMSRTKLHQLREAILQMNNTTTLLETRAIARNWRKEEREFMEELVQNFGQLYWKLEQKHLPTNGVPSSLLFPWFVDSEEKYRTPLLDFVELYDFMPVDENA